MSLFITHKIYPILFQTNGVQTGLYLILRFANQPTEICMQKTVLN